MRRHAGKLLNEPVRPNDERVKIQSPSSKQGGIICLVDGLNLRADFFIPEKMGRALRLEQTRLQLVDCRKKSLIVTVQIFEADSFSEQFDAILLKRVYREVRIDPNMRTMLLGICMQNE